MRRKTFVLMLALGAALACAAVAYGGNAGFAPATPHSPNAQDINASYKWIALYTGVIFVVVEGTLLAFIYRYRRRRRARTAEGPQIHGATRLELIWTAIPVLILAAIAGFILYKLPGIRDVPAAKAQGGPLMIRVDAHQFYWQFTYPDGEISINELHVPVHRVVQVNIFSHDVVHSWWIPELGGKFDAVPGRQNHTWFQANQIGTFRGRCGEFCGVFHAEMKARVQAESPADYRAWLASAASQLGQNEWAGVCAQCHGLQGQGGYGPAIATSTLLTTPQSLHSLLVNGQNRLKPTETYMPPVGSGWTNEQFAALNAYLKQNIVKGAPSGG
ncbi:MAG TPA: cytochrome c oxidase subunit II [Gaiellaceae bacterium]|nr:cytochrome c oxidase subunit II [Gaiellaceae bacterium]